MSALTKRQWVAVWSAGAATAVIMGAFVWFLISVFGTVEADEPRAAAAPMERVAVSDVPPLAQRLSARLQSTDPWTRVGDTALYLRHEDMIFVLDGETRLTGEGAYDAPGALAGAGSVIVELLDDPFGDDPADSDRTATQSSVAEAIRAHKDLEPIALFGGTVEVSSGRVVGRSF